MGHQEGGQAMLMGEQMRGVDEGDGERERVAREERKL